MTILGENIKKLRERAGMTIADLGKVSGVGQSTISEIETGKAKNPKTSTISKIAKNLNTTIDALYDMEIEHEYILTDVKEAFDVVLNQESLTLNGKPLTNEAITQLKNGIKMLIQFTTDAQNKNK